jgi:hypothetical protein
VSLDRLGLVECYSTESALGLQKSFSKLQFEVGFGRVLLDRLVLVECYSTVWFWSSVARPFGFGRVLLDRIHPQIVIFKKISAIPRWIECRMWRHDSESESESESENATRTPSHSHSHSHCVFCVYTEHTAIQPQIVILKRISAIPRWIECRMSRHDSESESESENASRIPILTLTLTVCAV